MPRKAESKQQAPTPTTRKDESKQQALLPQKAESKQQLHDPSEQVLEQADQQECKSAAIQVVQLLCDKQR